MDLNLLREIVQAYLLTNADVLTDEEKQPIIKLLADIENQIIGG